MIDNFASNKFYPQKFEELTAQHTSRYNLYPIFYLEFVASAFLTCDILGLLTFLQFFLGLKRKNLKLSH